MTPFSIVIVAKNAELKIGRLLESLKGLSDDVIVCDSGSEDNTINLAKGSGARVYSITWQGYGKSKNTAIGYAKYDWILSLDSDEKIDAELYSELENWSPVDDGTVYQLKWKNFFGNQWIQESDWGSKWKNRLFNKHVVRWDDAIAHEDITSAVALKKQRLNGYLEHYSFRDKAEYESKMINSAMITALKYHQEQRLSTYLHIFISPLFTFIKTYIFKRGFLDGSKGWLIAKTTAYYTYLKYTRLKELNKYRDLDSRFLEDICKTTRPRLLKY